MLTNIPITTYDSLIVSCNGLLYMENFNEHPAMLIQYFNNTIDNWITELGHYEPDKLFTKPGPGNWSLGQVYMHLIEETSYYIEQMECCLTHNENSSAQMDDKAKMMFSKNEFPDEIIKGDPFISENVKQPVSKFQLQKEMQELKLKMNVIGNKIINKESTGKARHPGLGYFSAKEWFQYADMHLRHHLRQKRRIDNYLKITG